MSSDARDDALRRLETALDECRDELIELIADLLRQSSELGHEAAAQAFVHDHLRGSDLVVESWEPDDAIHDLPNSGDSGVPFAARPNVSARRSGHGGGRSLILNGHIDVVSPEPVAAWTHDPWGATVIGDLMYGRGALDMKSGVALNLFLPRLSRLPRDLDLPLAGDLIIHSVIEEECTGNGALAASRRDRADAAIVTEPEGGGFTHTQDSAPLPVWRNDVGALD